MKTNKNRTKFFAANSTMELVLFSTLVLVTLFFWTPALDAFNYPKQAALSILIFSLTILLFPSLIQGLLSYKENWLKWVPVLYLAWLIVVALIHGINRPQILWGIFSRANGLLTTSSFVLIVIILATHLTFRLVEKIALAALISLVAIAIYGFIQLFGADPVDWVNPYNQIIATFGNPNFSSAALVVLSLISSYFVLESGVPKFLRALSLVAICSSLFLSVKSQSIQGLISFIAAVQLYLLIKVILGSNSKRRKLVKIVLFIPLNLLVLLGLLDIGPLRGVVYQYTLSVRAHYWRVALSMMQDHPIFGVGIDSYGLYYQQYRELEFVRQYGPSLVTNNAHNVYLQAGATTGVLGLVFLIILTILVVIRFSLNISKFSGRQANLYIIMFVAWVAYTLQSLVSIEQIGIALWGWTLTGVLLGYPLILKTVENRNFLWHRENFPATFVYILLALALLVPGTHFVRQDLDLRRALSQPPSNQDMVSNEERGLSIYNSVQPIVELQEYSNFAIRNLFQAGPASKGIEVAEESLRKNPRLYTSLQLLTSAYRQLGDNEKAIEMYRRMQVLDPYNYFDLLEQGKLLVEMGRVQEGKKLFEKVMIYGNNEAIETARTLILKLS